MSRDHSSEQEHTHPGREPNEDRDEGGRRDFDTGGGGSPPGPNDVPPARGGPGLEDGADRMFLP